MPGRGDEPIQGHLLLVGEPGGRAVHFHGLAAEGIPRHLHLAQAEHALFGQEARQVAGVGGLGAELAQARLATGLHDQLHEPPLALGPVEGFKVHRLHRLEQEVRADLGRTPIAHMTGEQATVHQAANLRRAQILFQAGKAHTAAAPRGEQLECLPFRCAQVVISGAQERVLGLQHPPPFPADLYHRSGPPVQGRGERGAQGFTGRGQIIGGCPEAQVQQPRTEERFVAEDLDDGSHLVPHQLAPANPNLNDHPHLPLAPQRDEHMGATLDLAGEFDRNRVGQGRHRRNQQRNFDIAGDGIGHLRG